MKRINLDIFLLAILAVVITALYLSTAGQILAKSTLETMAYQIPVLGLLTLAQMYAMINGGIDLSIISVANFSGIIAAILLKHLETPLALAIPAALLAAVAIGAINGLVISLLGAPALLVTLATGFLTRGIALGLTKGYIISGLPQHFVKLGAGTILSVPTSFVVLLIVSALITLVLYQTIYGKQIYLVGANPLASLFSGTFVARIQFSVYILSSLLAGLAGLIMVARFNAAQADYGGGFLLVTVLICVLGGVDPSGGVGRPETVITALVILQLISTGFNIMRTSQYLASSLWGALLLFVLLFSRKLAKRQL